MDVNLKRAGEACSPQAGSLKDFNRHALLEV